MDETPDFYFDTMAQVHLPSWSKGRVTLVGDAGYAVSPIAGQGSSVALVGAYVLAGELYKAHGDHKIAFNQYQKNLKTYVTENQKLAKVGGAIIGGSRLPKLTLVLLWVVKQVARLIPKQLALWWKTFGLKRTTKAANCMTLEIY